ncbi:NAD(P)-dependent alcohol dehydrogenase [Plantactinospora sp. B6F1]|uniref:NAD(P)-dependent alcohol dehydrogenase n=1 Tax=Plantactinospora sp. B6F1 TaxID=3158971 RepID=UPI0032D94F33
MKAAVLRAYGPPEALEITDVQRPAPGDDEVLVRVRATSVNPYDWHHIRGEPLVARLMPDGPGLRTPAITVPGCDMAGQVEAVGRNVTGFRPGDDVYALLAEGGFGEYVCVREELLAPKPANLSYEQAAAVPMAGVTALVGLRDAGRIQPGQRVLVNGASGGVGTFAVQLARAFGATVTGVCSTRNLELVGSLGADEVVDYTTEDFTRRGRRYDLLLDNAGSRSVSAYRRVLTRNGTLVAVGGPASRWLQPAGRVFAAVAVAPLVSQRIAVADAVRCPDKSNCLRLLTRLIEDGTVTPVVDRRYPFAEIHAAVRYQEEGHCPGKVVVTL